MHDLVEAMEKCKELKELKQKLVDCFKAEISVKGLECVDTQEAGEVVDMIKDLAETEKECMEALYYQKVTEVMLTYDEPRYGYNPSRSATTGRYTSGGNTGGRGGRMGFRPHEPWTGEDAGEWDGYDYMQDAMMGYDGGGASTARGGFSGGNRGGSRGGGSRGGTTSMGYWPGREIMDDMNPRYGEEYNRYRMTRRHYTETKSPEDKREMSEHAEKHLRDTIDTVKDIWGDADPDLKKKMKEDLTKLVNSMTM